MEGSNAGLHIIECGASYHISAYAHGWRLINEITRLHWVSNSPDMSPRGNGLVYVQFALQESNADSIP